jgi:hypothetical protein
MARPPYGSVTEVAGSVPVPAGSGPVLATTRHDVRRRETISTTCGTPATHWTLSRVPACVT